MFSREKVGDDYQYIRLNQAAQDLLSNEAIGKMISTVTSKRNFSIIQKNYDEAIREHKQVDYVDYAYVQSEVRKYETSVRPLKYKNEDYILAITKEILYDRSIEDKFYLCGPCLTMPFSTVILSAEGIIYEVNSSFMDDFQLDNETVKQKCLWIYQLFQKKKLNNLKFVCKRLQEGKRWREVH